jgi:hypothetical protein
LAAIPFFCWFDFDGEGKKRGGAGNYFRALKIIFSFLENTQRSKSNRRTERARRWVAAQNTFLEKK